MLSPDIDVYRIQPPGRETRFGEGLVRAMNDYVDELLVDLRPVLQAPFAFFGHSMGSLAAFNMALRLRRDGDRLPDHLLVSAFRAPHAPPMKRIHELADGDFIRELRETYDGIPDALLNEPEVLALTLPIVRADLAVAASHRYAGGPPLSCPITAFGGTDDRWADERQLTEWGVQTSGPFDLRMFHGGHFYIVPQMEALGSAIRETLQA